MKLSHAETPSRLKFRVPCSVFRVAGFRLLASLARRSLGIGGWLLVSSLSLLATVPQAAGAAPNTDQSVPDELDLKTAIKFALENNFDIRQAQERIRQQEGVIIQVKAAEIPNLSASYQYSRLDPGRLFPGTTGNIYSWAINLQATQNIFAGGGNRGAINSQKRTREAAMLELKGIINNVLLQVRQNFYNVLLAQKKISVQEAALALAEETLKNVQNRYDAGTVSKFDLLRAQVAAANARPLLITARNDYRLAIEALRQTLGFTTRSEPNIVKIPKFIGELTYTPTEFDLRTALDAARANRPELARFAKLEEARAEDIRTGKAGYYPRLDAVAGYQWSTAPTGSFFGLIGESNLRGWLVGVQGSWAIFDGRATHGRVAQARSLLEQAKLTTAAQQLSIDVEVRTAFSSWQEAVELVNANKATVEQAEEALRLAEARFEAGSATQLDVLQARVDLTQARTNEVQAFYTYNVAVAALHKAAGDAEAYTE